MELQKRYEMFDNVGRASLWKRALNKGGEESAIKALAARDAFVQMCLMAQQPNCGSGIPSVQQMNEVGRLPEPCKLAISLIIACLTLSYCNVSQ